MKITTRQSRCIALGVLLLAPLSYAEPLAIVNAGFEDIYQGTEVLTGSFPVGPAPNGWIRYDLNGSPISGSLVGVLNPGTQADYDADGAGLLPCFPAGAPEGDNVALLFKTGPAGADEYGIDQVLVDVLEASVEYTLTVEVGNIQTCAGLPPGFRNTFNLEGFPGYRIELRAGGQMLAMDNNSLHPSEGEFETSTFTFIAPENHPQLGQALVVRLVNLNIPDVGLNLEVDFDDVRLDALALHNTPIPIGFLVPLAMLCVLIAHRAGSQKMDLQKNG